MSEADSRRARILIIEANLQLRRELARALTAAGYGVDAFASTREASCATRLAPHDLRIVDLAASGVRSWLESDDDLAPRIALTVDAALHADEHAQVLQAGDRSRTTWLRKPFSIEQLEDLVLEMLDLAQAGAGRVVDPILRTQEPVLQERLDRARRWARRDVSISIVGEIGTGRRALADQIHAWSGRSGMALERIQRADLEAAGTGGAEACLTEAVSRAAGGSLLLVEPADFEPRFQQVLLECLRNDESDPPRWLCISREPLDESVRSGRLSLELQYRLEMTSVEILPFRARPLDAEALCNSTARRVAKELGQTPPAFDRSMIEELARDGFRGNRLGLESRLRNAMIRGEGNDPRVRAHVIQDSSPSGAVTGSGAQSAGLNLKELERDTIIRALAHWQGNRTRASESLGISVRTLRNKIREYDLR